MSKQTNNNLEVTRQRTDKGDTILVDRNAGLEGAGLLSAETIAWDGGVQCSRPSSTGGLEACLI